MLAVQDFSCANTRPVPYPYIETLRRETFGEDVSTSNEGYAVFHWEDVIWRINREYFPSIAAVMDDPEVIWAGVDPLPPIDLSELDW
jgi:hypothetical protein